MQALVGYTGFVGSNLDFSGDFDRRYNSKNIQEAYGTCPDLLIYAGIRAEKYIANSNEKADWMKIEQAIENIKKINPDKLVLISTIDVYNEPIDVDEESKIVLPGLQPYGKNRYLLEKWVCENIKNSMVIRLPGLYGKNLKKNFIYDMINIVPMMLRSDKYQELSEKSALVKKSYQLMENGFFKCIAEKPLIDNLKKEFINIGFTAMDFTDSRGIFQFYNLQNLWEHIGVAINENIKILNIATEPVTVEEIYQYVYGKHFKNEIAAIPPYYNYKTKYDHIFGRSNGYIFNKEEILKDIKVFVEGFK